MMTRQTTIWSGVMPLMFALHLDAQSDWADKSPHKTGFITVNKVRLHYLDWGGKGETLLFSAWHGRHGASL